MKNRNNKKKEVQMNRKEIDKNGENERDDPTNILNKLINNDK